MKEINLKKAIEEITMPQQMQKELLAGCRQKCRTKNTLFRYSRLIAAAAAAIAVTFTVSIPAYAAYDLYQTKNIDVFFEQGVSQEQIDDVGEALSSMEGIYAVRFISAEEAFESFAKECLTEELAASFDENPLADSFSYRVTIKLNADTAKIREQIAELDGVRKISNQYELKETP